MPQDPAIALRERIAAALKHVPAMDLPAILALVESLAQPGKDSASK